MGTYFNVGRVRIVMSVTLTLVGRFTNVPQRRCGQILQLCMFQIDFFMRRLYRLTYFYIMLTGFNVILITICFGRMRTLLIQYPASIHGMTINEITYVRMGTFTHYKIMSACLRLITNRSYR